MDDDRAGTTRLRTLPPWVGQRARRGGRTGPRRRRSRPRRATRAEIASACEALDGRAQSSPTFPCDESIQTLRASYPTIVERTLPRHARILSSSKAEIDDEPAPPSPEVDHLHGGGGIGVRLAVDGDRLHLSLDDGLSFAAGRRHGHLPHHECDCRDADEERGDDTGSHRDGRSFGHGFPLSGASAHRTGRRSRGLRSRG